MPAARPPCRALCLVASSAERLMLCLQLSARRPVAASTARSQRVDLILPFLLAHLGRAALSHICWCGGADIRHIAVGDVPVVTLRTIAGLRINGLEAAKVSLLSESGRPKLRVVALKGSVSNLSEQGSIETSQACSKLRVCPPRDLQPQAICQRKIKQPQAKAGFHLLKACLYTLRWPRCSCPQVHSSCTLPTVRLSSLRSTYPGNITNMCHPNPSISPCFWVYM